MQDSSSPAKRRRTAEAAAAAGQGLQPSQGEGESQPAARDGSVEGASSACSLEPQAVVEGERQRDLPLEVFEVLCRLLVTDRHIRSRAAA